VETRGDAGSSMRRVLYVAPSVDIESQSFVHYSGGVADVC
jgi:hypothetical protein